MVSVLKNSEAVLPDAAGESRTRGPFFDIVKIGRKRNVDGEVLAVGSKDLTKTFDGTFSQEVHTTRTDFGS